MSGALIEDRQQLVERRDGGEGRRREPEIRNVRGELRGALVAQQRDGRGLPTVFVVVDSGGRGPASHVGGEFQLRVFEIGCELWTTDAFWGDLTHRLDLATNWDVPEAERTEQQAALRAAYPRWPGEDTHEAFTLGWNAARDNIPA